MKRNFMWRIFLILWIVTACNKTENAGDPCVNENKENFVTQESIRNILAGVTIHSNSLPEQRNTKINEPSEQNIKEIIPVTDKAGAPSFYIVNYNEGFVILSADKRAMPVLAYSATGNFRIDNSLKGFRYGLGEWLEEMNNFIGNIRSLNQKQSEETKEAWKTENINYFINGFTQKENISTKGYPVDPEPDNGCQLTDEQVGPLLTTEWGQGPGFNDYVPLSGCTKNPNGKADAGCVAVAVAQVLKYHKYPATYQWDAMPDKGGSIHTAMLMSQIGEAVNMQYTCSGSGASAESAVNALLNTFGYANAVLADYDWRTVERSLRFRYLVILSGGTRGSGGKYVNGHSWVCDGFRIFAGHVIDEKGNHSGCGSYLHLHMNWGWAGVNDGWFGFNNWITGNSSYNYKRRMIYNIRARR